jgi:uncharacterized repeat protein (TIGR02543 family)
MPSKTKLAVLFAVSLMAIASISVMLPQAAAAPKVNVTFTASGYSSYSGEVLTVGSTTYNTWNLPVTLSLKPGDTYTVTAVPSITGWDSKTYAFSSWTNGNGLTTNTGTFTVPSTATTVTANYAKTTQTVTFSASGLSNVDTTVLTIDGTSYLYSDLNTATFLWATGSTHTVTAASTVYSWDTPAKGYTFTSWTNGNGLVTSSGTFTTPASDVTVTANYAQSTVQVTFSASGLSNLNSDTVLTIDGTSYTIFDLPNLKLQWIKGSTHTVTAVNSITGWDSVTHVFSSWTNGNGLTTNTGTFTTPNSDVAVTVNYVTGTSSPQTTTLTVSCTNGTSGNSVIISGVLTSASTGIADKTISLTYYDGATWQAIGTATSLSDGSYSYTWTIPEALTDGVYPLKADFAGDSNYQASSASGELIGFGVHMEVLPESWGSIIALIACFGGAIVFFKLRSKPR